MCQMDLIMKGVYNIWRNLAVIFLQPAGAYCLNMAISEIFSLRSGYFGTFFRKNPQFFSKIVFYVIILTWTFELILE